MPNFAVTSITLKSYDTVQDDDICRSVVIQIESITGDRDWFPIIKSADGFALNPDEVTQLASFLAELVHHNDKVTSAWK
jgi:hypothetical protein